MSKPAALRGVSGRRASHFKRSARDFAGVGAALAEAVALGAAGLAGALGAALGVALAAGLSVAGFLSSQATKVRAPRHEDATQNHERTRMSASYHNLLRANDFVSVRAMLNR